MNILNPNLLALETSPFARNIDHSLMISKKSQRESYTSICKAPTPRPTKTHMPIPHNSLIGQTATEINNMGWEITGASYASSYDQGNAHFVFQLETEIAPGIHMQIGGHTSNIKMRSAILQLQTDNKICTNMDVVGEVALRRKHTPRILEELPALISKAMSRLNEIAEEHKSRIRKYQNKSIDDTTAHDIMIKAMKADIVPATYLPIIVKEWSNPTFEEFKEDNLYTLYNCFTEAYKRSPAETPRRTQRLLGMMDNLITEPSPLFSPHDLSDEDILF